MQFTADDVKVHSIHQKWIRQLLSSNTVLPMLSSPSRTTQKIHRKSIINALLSVALHYITALFIPTSYWISTNTTTGNTALGVMQNVLNRKIHFRKPGCS